MEIEPNTNNANSADNNSNNNNDNDMVKEEKSIYDLDNKEYESADKTDKTLYNNTAIVFRNRIYRVLNNGYIVIYKLYDYFESKHYYNKHDSESENKRIHGAIVSISGNKIDNWNNQSQFNAVTYDQFMSEMQIIEHEDVPSVMMQCIKNIQESKIVKEIPYDKIKEHEAYHVKQLKKQLQYFLSNIVSKIFEALEAEKKVIEVIATHFYVSEYSMGSKVEILYEFPNADGVKRENFMDYVYYLFEKIYPKPDMEEIITPKDWFFHKVYELLCEEYPMFNITADNYKYYIDLKHPKILC